MNNNENLSYAEQLEEYYQYCEEKAKEVGVDVKYYIEEFELW